MCIFAYAYKYPFSPNSHEMKIQIPREIVEDLDLSIYLEYKSREEAPPSSHRTYHQTTPKVNSHKINLWSIIPETLRRSIYDPFYSKFLRGFR